MDPIRRVLDCQPGHSRRGFALARAPAEVRDAALHWPVEHPSGLPDVDACWGWGAALRGETAFARVLAGAIAAGVLPPFGHGAFTPPGWGGFTSLALTESLFDEWLLLHANVGVAVGDDGANSSRQGVGGASTSRIRTLVTAGFGFQARIAAGLHGVAEVYCGDPTDPRTSFPAMQVGFRYIFNDQVQIDGTFGSTLIAVVGAGGHPQTEPWGTLGLRLVTPELWSAHARTPMGLERPGDELHC